MPDGMKTLTRYTIEQEHRHPGSSGEFSALLNVVATAAKIIANQVTRGRIVESLGASQVCDRPASLHRRMDAIANAIMVDQSESSGPLAALLSEQMSGFHPILGQVRRGRYMLAFDPLDGSSNIDVNLPVGTIFSVLRAPEGGRAVVAEDFLQPGTRQVCAGFTLYGPATMLVLTTGSGVAGFTLDREIGAFVLTHPRMRIPEDTSGFAINAANERFWQRPVRRYVHECLDGIEGPRSRDFNMRWVASLVADAFHILTRGGVYLYPFDTRDPERPGRVSLLYGANPIAFVIEQAGGAASTGHERVLEVAPVRLHQQIPLVFGSRNEVCRIERYHREPDAGPPFDASLFGTRTLFRPARH